ncbi:MAG: hypothetical protein IPI49_15465 [Myxococcales bacterium]|nr:hypothetical protein [Myxococcales bacterium]
MIREDRDGRWAPTAGESRREPGAEGAEGANGGDGKPGAEGKPRVDDKTAPHDGGGAASEASPPALAELRGSRPDLVPWFPERTGAASVEASPPGPTPDELEDALAAARAQGKADALAELSTQRRRLRALCSELMGLQQRSLDWLASAALDASMVVIEAWLEASEPDRRARLRPVLERWVREVGASQLAAARVSPVDAAAWRDLVADLPIEVRVDSTLQPGDVQIWSERSMLQLRWRDRLAELRGELLAVLPEAPMLPADARAANPAGSSGEGWPSCEGEGDINTTRRWPRIPV